MGKRADYISKFRDAMNKGGIPHSGKIVPDGAFHRVIGKGKNPDKPSAWYKLYNDSVPYGFFGDFRLCTSGSWLQVASKNLSSNEMLANKASMKKLNKINNLLGNFG